MTEATVTKKTDRRVQRTVALLRDALMALIQEKGYDAITVQDIADRANVARTTFYLHFKDKDELLFEGMRAIYDDLIEREMRSTDAQSFSLFDLASPADFEHVAEHADFYRVMLSERGSMAFTIRVLDYLASVCQEGVAEPLEKSGKAARIPTDAIAYIIAGAQIGIMRWWLQNNMQHTPEEMGVMGRDMIVNGAAWALGLRDDKL